MAEAMVQVPRRLLEELQKYLHAQPEPTVLIDDRNGHWTESMVAEFKQEIERRYTHAAQIYKAAAEASPNLLLFREFIKSTGLAERQASAELGGASKAARRLFGRVTWPMTAQDSGEGMTYLMPLEVARWWLGN